jgi:putative ubiquitin-RnfH superfamily antitoxin RatB of RatAB toxin-antitoxin module
MVTLRVEVVYALAGVQDLVALELAQGATARDAAEASGLPLRHGLTIERLVLGNFGKRIAADYLLRDGDRVEILRPLAADPKEARRRRARRRSSNT